MSFGGELSKELCTRRGRRLGERLLCTDEEETTHSDILPEGDRLESEEWGRMRDALGLDLCFIYGVMWKVGIPFIERRVGVCKRHIKHPHAVSIYGLIDILR